MDLKQSMMISAAGLRAQSVRMRIISENLANQDSTATRPGEAPYSRKLVTFRSMMDRELGIETVKPGRVTTDKTPFGRKYEPGHPAADANGYVLTTNVEPLIELMDMRQAERSYEANLNAIEASRNMMARTVEILR